MSTFSPKQIKEGETDLKNDTSSYIGKIVEHGISISLGYPVPINLLYPFLHKLLQKKELVKIGELLKKEKLIEGKEKNNLDLFENAIIIPNKFVDNSSNIFNDIIFDGVFKNSLQFKEIFPSNRISELIVLTKKEAKRIFTFSENISLGLNKSNDANNELYPISNFSQKKWENLTLRIRRVFSMLGAKRISIVDVTDTSIETDINIKAKATKCGFGVEFSHSFNISEEISECYYDKEKANELLNSLKEYPQFHETAIQIINGIKRNHFEFEERINLNFDLGLDTLAVFQGCMKGGYSRQFKVTLDFF